MIPKLAFTTLACPGWTIQQVADAATQLGYDAVELRLLDGEVIDPVADYGKVIDAVSVLRDAGIEVCALDTSCTFNHSDESERSRQLDILSQWISLAGQVNVPVLRVFGGAAGGEQGATEAQADGWVTGALRQAAPWAERAGVTIALETHDSFASARRVARVLDDVASPHVAALWDSFHPYRLGETPEEVMSVLNGRIALVHLKDARRVGSDWQLVLAGEGDVPLREIRESLARHGYAGYLSVEWEKKWHPELPEPEIALPQHLRWLRAPGSD